MRPGGRWTASCWETQAFSGGRRRASGSECAGRSEGRPAGEQQARAAQGAGGRGRPDARARVPHGGARAGPGAGGASGAAGDVPAVRGSLRGPGAVGVRAQLLPRVPGPPLGRPARRRGPRATPRLPLLRPAVSPPQPEVQRAAGGGGAHQPGAAREAGGARGARGEAPRGPHPHDGLPGPERRGCKEDVEEVFWMGTHPFLLQRCGWASGRTVSPDFLNLLPHLSRFDVPTPKSSNSDDDLPEDYPVVKNMLHRLAADLTLDPGTAHRRLLVSADRRSVQLAPPGTPTPPDGPARFDQLPAVLGAQGFGAGRHCWEVETADAACGPDSSGEDEADEDKAKGRYAVGAAGESVRRKGRVGLCPAGAVWAVEGRGGRLWALTAPDPTPLGGAGPVPRRIRVDLDWERGRVAFYDGHSLDLLFAFQGPGPLGERVFPLLCTRHAHATLRIVPAEG
ncbi:RING finger protein 39 isoform X1 [Canis aureus]